MSQIHLRAGGGTRGVDEETAALLRRIEEAEVDSTLKPQPYNPNPEHSTLNTQHSTLDPEP